MHDTFLNERIYEALLKMCHDSKILKLTKIHLIVNIDSHISKQSICEHFKERNNKLIDDYTKIIVEKQDVGKQSAIIESIEGESSNE